MGEVGEVGEVDVASLHSLFLAISALHSINDRREFDTKGICASQIHINAYHGSVIS